MMAGICSAGVPWPSSSPARRFRLPSARIVAVRSPTPATPAKVSCRAPRARAYATHSRHTCAVAIPAAFMPWACAAAPARAAAFLAAPATSTRIMSSERSQTRPASSKTLPSCSRRSGSRLPRTSAAVPETASFACAGPPSEAIARARTRSETYSDGSAAEPLPLELDHRPDAGTHGVGEGGRRVVGAGKGERSAHPELDLLGPDLPAPPDLLRAVDRDGQDRGAGLEREPSEATLRPRQRTASMAGPLGEDADGSPALQDLAGGGQRLRVRLSAPDGVGAEAVEDPALPALLEELDLGDIVERPA